jgi:hypothetical protein
MTDPQFSLMLQTMRAVDSMLADKESPMNDEDDYNSRDPDNVLRSNDEAAPGPSRGVDAQAQLEGVRVRMTMKRIDSLASALDLEIAWLRQLLAQERVA